MAIRFIDLFAGIGGIRKGLEQAIIEYGEEPVCVFTSEIKPHAITILQQNHPEDEITGDITAVNAEDIPDFDILCAGFPCQAFSSAGTRKGFADTRGTLFFDVERILRAKRPAGFILENVEGLVNHDHGRTLAVILNRLDDIGYHVSYRVLNSKQFGVAQERKRIYITGTFDETVNLANFEPVYNKLNTILETGKPTLKSPFIKKLLSKYKPEQLYGKSIKDKRGGKDNIHSWDIEIKGHVSADEKRLLNVMLTERRKKHWAASWGIDWMDGMPLTERMISTFFIHPRLNEMLNNLVDKGYLVYEHPKKKVVNNGISTRVYDVNLERGYNIVTGKLSFEINKILDPNDYAPTLVATDMQRLYVVDGKGLRKLTLREGLRLFGYPEDFRFDINEKEGFDLLGNTVVVPVIKAVCSRLLNTIVWQR